jgi:hypothetical protein
MPGHAGLRTLHADPTAPGFGVIRGPRHHDLPADLPDDQAFLDSLGGAESSTSASATASAGGATGQQGDMGDLVLAVEAIDKDPRQSSEARRGAILLARREE